MIFAMKSLELSKMLFSVSLYLQQFESFVKKRNSMKKFDEKSLGGRVAENKSVAKVPKY